MRWRASGNSVAMPQQDLPDGEDVPDDHHRTPSSNPTRRLEDEDTDEPDLATCSEEDDKTMTLTDDGGGGTATRADNGQQQHRSHQQHLHPRDHDPPPHHGRLGGLTSSLSSDSPVGLPPSADLTTMTTASATMTKASTALTEAEDEGGGSGDADTVRPTKKRAASALDPGDEDEMKQSALEDQIHHFNQQQDHVMSSSSNNNNNSPSHASASSSANPSSNSRSSSALQPDDDKEDDEDADDEDGVDHSQPPPDQDDGDASTPRWKPQTVQSTCEFTHTITNYSQKRESGCKKAEYSSTTVDEFGNRWRLIVYVNGNGRASNHHLSLFLQVGLYSARFSCFTCVICDPLFINLVFFLLSIAILPGC